MSYYYSNRAVNGRTGKGTDTDFLSDWFSGDLDAKGKDKDLMVQAMQAPRVANLPRPASKLPMRRDQAPDATFTDLEERIASFQRENGLKEDGLILPAGETAQTINALMAKKIKSEGTNPALPLLAGLEADVNKHFPLKEGKGSMRESAGRNSYRHALMSYRLASQFGDAEAQQFEKAVMQTEPTTGKGPLQQVLGKARNLASDQNLQLMPDDEVVRDALWAGQLGRLADHSETGFNVAEAGFGQNIRDAFGVSEGEPETWLSLQKEQEPDAFSDSFSATDTQPNNMDRLFAEHNQALMR